MKVTTEVLSVLSTCLRIDGINVVIAQQLDRKLYVGVNKVLEACGGTWSRKARAHVFVAWDPAEKIEQVLATGEVTVAKSDLCFFPTPVALAKRLVQATGVDVGHRALEPSAGSGRIVDALLLAGANPTACERDNAMRAALEQRGTFGVAPVDDFMKLPPVRLYDRVVMNPPFTKCGEGDGLDHVLHALKFLRPGGRLGAIMPNGILFREDRRHRAFRYALPFGTTFTELPEDSFKESGTRVRTVMLIAEVAS